VLDLFAGYGCVGLELLSQGAAEVVFVERHLATARILWRNVESLELTDRATLLRMPVARALEEALSGTFDVVYLDPPYEQGQAAETLAALAARAELVAADGVIIVQHSEREALGAEVEPWRRVKEQRAGDTVLSFFGRGETR